MSWPAVKLAFKQEDFRQYVETLTWPRWRPSAGFTWHNTYRPRISDWMKTAKEDAAKGLIPGTTRINNLEHYFWKQRGWPGAPHLFIAPDYIWVFNPLTDPGVHSPSWNRTRLGFEMIGDFNVEDDDAGLGLQIKRNCIFATAVLCEVLGLEPSRETIKLHNEDPKTTHTGCPGVDLAQDVNEMVEDVRGLMAGGEHDQIDTAVAMGDEPAPTEPAHSHGVVTTNGLNFRRGPGVSFESTGSLNRGVAVIVLKEEPNGSTSWLKVRTPAGHEGWVAGRYVKQEG